VAEPKVVHWDIGWPALLLGIAAVCSIYWFFVDPAFVESLMTRPTPGSGRIVGAVLLLSVGTALGAPFWFSASLMRGRVKIYFKPFVLVGMVALTKTTTSSEHRVKKSIAA
jgi:hypothetical protein